MRKVCVSFSWNPRLWCARAEKSESPPRRSFPWVLRETLSTSCVLREKSKSMTVAGDHFDLRHLSCGAHWNGGILYVRLSHYPFNRKCVLVNASCTIMLLNVLTLYIHDSYQRPRRTGRSCIGPTSVLLLIRVSECEMRNAS